ncbi:hypothetical protein BD289DRAFT_14551 [Coniella lustricola]|uniref:Uncharacterized protein n=1 Tax=Coniella lustricola TaxID=2025994 RepID=A0A2T3A453_9PEZI|nr:hypothetical protein BD289DRAFT_14551 [Coniella lustricola]
MNPIYIPSIYTSRTARCCEQYLPNCMCRQELGLATTLGTAGRTHAAGCRSASCRLCGLYENNCRRRLLKSHSSNIAPRLVLLCSTMWEGENEKKKVPPPEQNPSLGRPWPGLTCLIFGLVTPQLRPDTLQALRNSGKNRTRAPSCPMTDKAWMPQPTTS